MRRDERATDLELSNYDVIASEFDDQTYHALVRSDIIQQDPNQLFMIRGFRKLISDLEDPGHPSHVVYVDGACRGPSLDRKREIYSFDHHEECIRQVTLASCAQALLATRKRVIGAFGYKIIGNDPDMDTVLAAWALMHADRIAYDDKIFEKMRPIFNLQANIDTYGFGLEEFTDLDPKTLRETRGKLLWLNQEERALKKLGRWTSTDFRAYTERVFNQIDSYAFDMGVEEEEELEVEASEEIELPNGEKILYVQGSKGNVYTAKDRLITKPKKPGIVCLIHHDGRTKWTIHLTNFIPKYQLTPVFKRLREAETEAKKGRNVTDKHLLNTHWGGSDNIGGQPSYRDGIGPFIDGSAIKQIVKEELSRQIDLKKIDS